MATIHKRRTRTGDVVWELTHGTGSDRQRFVAGKTREEAEGVLAQFRRQLALHGQAPGELTITEAVGLYLSYLSTNRRPNTTKRYARVVTTFDRCYMQVAHAGVTRLRDVKPLHVEGFKRARAAGEITEQKSDEEVSREASLRARLRDHRRESAKDNAPFGWLGRHGIRARVSPRTINYELRVLFTFFHWAVRSNYLVANPASSIERFRLPKRALPKFMTSEDLRKFFGACTSDQRRLFMAILLTGMRKGEVEHLTWEDVSFELGVIFIREKPEVGWQPKTDERIIPISPVLHTLLLEQRTHRTSETWVFGNEAGNRDTHILEKLKAVCRRAGIRSSTVHALRHSFGAHLRMAGVSLADIADLLGHKDLATTQIYAKVLQEHLRTVVSKLTPLVAEPALGKHAAANSKEDSKKLIEVSKKRRP